MKFFERIFFSFLPTGHRVVHMRENPDVSPAGEWLFLALLLACTSYLWPIAGVVEAVRIGNAAAMAELRALGMELLVNDLLPIAFFIAFWQVMGQGLNARQKSRLAFMTWFPAVFMRVILQGIPLIAPKVAFYPLPVLSIPQIVALAESFANVALLMVFLRAPRPAPALKMPGVAGAALVVSHAVIAGVLFVYPLVMAMPRFVEAPDFTIPALGGGTCQLSAHRGRPVVLEFWSQYCPHCRRLIPEMEKLAESLGKEVDILSVHTGGGEKAAERVAQLVQGSRYPVCLDDGTATKAYKALSPPHRPEGVPHVVFIDRNGIIRRSASGYRSVDILRAEVQQSGILR